MTRWKLLTSLLALVGLLSCASMPGVTVPPELIGTWTFQGGEPTQDPLLSWKNWPDEGLTVEPSGRWVPHGRVPGVRTVLSPSQIVAVEDHVLTLAPETKGRAYQIYWRIREGRLQFWWGDHPDWLKPYVVYSKELGPDQP